MCGIAGLIDPGLHASELRRTLKRMTGTLVHRGPDDEGYFTEAGVGLGMRRLSIIDVAGGKQPIGSEDGSVQVICNGEIYNHLELRDQLEARGHIFRTRSDVEVLAHLHEERGVDCPGDLNGMFALAIWDRRSRRLLLARDRMGKKPLFYSTKGQRLLFGSEIKAILAADPTLAEADPDMTVSYFRLGFIPEPRTMFRHIRKLPAGHTLVYADGSASVTPYWRLKFEVDSERDAHSWVEELDAHLAEAVRVRLMSEVPLGVFLSGGLDSSTVVAYAHKAGLRPLKTFTIGFDRPEWDESADAKLVAEHFQTDHHVLTLGEQDLTNDLPNTLQTLVRHFDEPFGDPSALPTYHVARLAREHVTVILGGDGGDELFAGYNTYRGIKFAEFYRRMPAWLGKQAIPALAEHVARCLPKGRRYLAQRVTKVLRDSSLPFEEAYFSKCALCTDEVLQQLFSEAFLDRFRQVPPRIYGDDIDAVLRSDLPTVSKMGYVDQRLYLLEDMLVKVDRMSMAHSLEVRSPFLDHRLVEFASRMPPTLKLRNWQSKAILRDTVKPYLPRQAVRKRKQGFSVPLREWLRTSLREMVGDYLETDNARLPPDVFNRSSIRALLRQHGRGEADHSAEIWLLLNYAAWRELYVPGPSQPL